MALVINKHAEFDSNVFIKFDSISRKDDLKLSIQDCCLNNLSESAGYRPMMALAYLRQQLKLGAGSDSDIANELRIFVKTFSQSETEKLFSYARDAFDEMQYKFISSSEDYECFIKFFDEGLINDNPKYEAFLIDLEPDVWPADNWFDLIGSLISIQSEKTEELVAHTIEDVERFRGNLAEDYFKIDFYENAFDLCKEHKYKNAMATLFRELGSFYFYGDVYYLTGDDEAVFEDLGNADEQPILWDEDYRTDFEAGYLKEYEESFSGKKEYEYSIYVNKSWFTKDPKTLDMLKKIEEHNLGIKDAYYESFLSFDQLLPEPRLTEFGNHLFSNKGFSTMSQNYQAQFRKNLEEYLKELMLKDIDLPLEMAYSILSKTYLSSLHSMIYDWVGDHKTNRIALMKKIVLAIFLGEDYKDFSRLLNGQINQLERDEKKYFKEVFLTERSGIRDESILSGYCIDPTQ